MIFDKVGKIAGQCPQAQMLAEMYQEEQINGVIRGKNLLFELLRIEVADELFTINRYNVKDKKKSESKSAKSISQYTK